MAPTFSVIAFLLTEAFQRGFVNHFSFGTPENLAPLASGELRAASIGRAVT